MMYRYQSMLKAEYLDPGNIVVIVTFYVEVACRLSEEKDIYIKQTLILFM